MPKAVVPFNALRLTVPDDWDDRSIYTFVAPSRNTILEPSPLTIDMPEQTFRPNIVVTCETEQVADLDAYVRRQWQQSMRALPDLELVREGALTVGKRPAFQRVFNFSAEGTTVTQRQVFVLVDRVAYALTFSSLPESFEQDNTDLFEPVVSKLSFAGQS
jgi:hypothetical protein